MDSSNESDEEEDEYLQSMLYDSDDEEEFELGRTGKLAVTLGASNLLGASQSRSSYYVRDRIEWDLHVSSLLKEGNDSFRRSNVSYGV
mmetsp:Transcript_17897/g.36148  ORF Transcript_17897/g.36148 Transcript_17897/m.36148 type:complete len:88 (-) Transcript_17897:347-610(-)